MSSTRTISLLIALAFLPIAGFATAQAPVDPTTSETCDDGRAGVSVRESGAEVACVPELATPNPSVTSPCDGNVPGTSVRENGVEVLCIPEVARLTVSFHADGSEGPGAGCAGAASDHSPGGDHNYVTATIPPSPAPDFVLDERLADTHCIQVSNGAESASVGIPDPSDTPVVVVLGFSNGAFVPGPNGPGPITTGDCASATVPALTIDSATAPTPGTPPTENARCVKVTVRVDGELVLRVAAGIPEGVPVPTIPPCNPAEDPDACQAVVCSLISDLPVCDETGLPEGCDPTGDFDPVTCANLPGLEAGTLGYHAHFDFTPTLAADQEPAFRFVNNQVVITASLYNSTGPAAFEPGDITHRAKFVLSRFPPAADGVDADPLPDLQIERFADAYSPDFTKASIVVARDTLVTETDEPGTVWTIRVESPNTPIVAAEGTEMVPFPSAFSFYSVAAAAAFSPDNTDLADVLDAIPTPIRALPKPFATISAVSDALEGSTAGLFEVTVTPSPNSPSGWTDVELSIAPAGPGRAEASDYTLQPVSPATWAPTPNTIRIPGSTGSSDSAQIRVVPVDDDLLEYDESVELSIKETKDAAVDPESAISAIVTLEDDEKPWVRILAEPVSNFTAKEAGPVAARIVFQRQTPDEAEPNPVLGAFELKFNRAGSEADLDDFAAPPCASPIDLPEVGCVVPPVTSCPGEVADSPLAGTPVMEVCAALAEALTVQAAIQGCETLEASCRLVFPAGAVNTTVLLMPADDAELEMPEESIRVNVVDGDAYDVHTTQGSRTIQLLDNEPRPTIALTLNSATTHESTSSPLLLTLTRTVATPTEPTRVPILVAGEGTYGADYQVVNLAGKAWDIDPIPGGFAIEVPVDQTAVTVAVKALQDTESEGDESVTFALDKGLFTKAAKKSAFFFIGDDDPLPVLILRVLDDEAGESGPDEATFVVERISGPATDLTVSLVKTGGSAQEGLDYTLSATQVNLPADATTAVVTLTPLNDDLREGLEAVRIALVEDGTFNLCERVACRVEPPGPTSVVLRIADDDAPTVRLSVPDADLSEEGATSAVVTIHRTPVALDKPLTVSYTVRGSASPTSDYVALPGTATIPAGATSVDVVVKAVDDLMPDANEQLTIEFRQSTLYAVQAPLRTTLTILDNDLPVAGDQDGDGLPNAQDICPNHADPEPADLDKDLKGDACDDDQDGDGATDAAELAAGTDARDPDTDRDLVADGKEVKDGSDPLDPFSPDYRAKDVEAFLEDDGMHVTWSASDPRVERFLVWRLSEPELVAEVDASKAGEYEVVDDEFPGGRHTYRIQAVLDGQSAAGYDAASSAGSAPVFASLCTAQPLDSDGDDLCDAREIELGTDPNVPDTDGDGLGDGAETLGRYGDATDPLEVDTDGDGIDDGDEVDLESVSADSAGADLDAAWIGIAAVLAGVVLVLSLVGVVRFMRRS